MITFSAFPISMAPLEFLAKTLLRLISSNGAGAVTAGLACKTSNITMHPPIIAYCWITVHASSAPQFLVPAAGG